MAHRKDAESHRNYYTKRPQSVIKYSKKKGTQSEEFTSADGTYDISKYNMMYTAAAYERIELKIYKGRKTLIREIAKIYNESMNNYVMSSAMSIVTVREEEAYEYIARTKEDAEILQQLLLFNRLPVGHIIGRNITISVREEDADMLLKRRPMFVLRESGAPTVYDMKEELFANNMAAMLDNSRINFTKSGTEIISHIQLSDLETLAEKLLIFHDNESVTPSEQE